MIRFNFIYEYFINCHGFCREFQDSFPKDSNFFYFYLENAIYPNCYSLYFKCSVPVSDRLTPTDYLFKIALKIYLIVCDQIINGYKHQKKVSLKLITQHCYFKKTHFCHLKIPRCLILHFKSAFSSLSTSIYSPIFQFFS